MSSEINKDDLVPIPYSENSTEEGRRLLAQLMLDHKKCGEKNCPKCAEVKSLFLSQYDIRATRGSIDDDMRA